MSSSASWPGFFKWALLGFMVAAPSQSAFALAPASEPGSRDVSIAEYRAHLENLDALVAACQKQRAAEACDPAKVGPDDRVLLASGPANPLREVPYGWLRILLDRAAEKEPSALANITPTQPSKDPPPTVDALLTMARQRLQQDWKQAGSAARPSPDYAPERNSLAAILARKQYHGVAAISARDRFVEWLENWLDNALAKLEEFGSRSPWIAFLLRGLLLAAICLGLVWTFIRIERRSRIKLVPEPLAVPGAPSAREWQLWLADAHTMAAQDLWREAIHFLYWAAIAQLESRHLWPADRARTPREYLRLLPASDPRRPNLASLTRSFERTWYGGRQAGPSDFNQALKLAAELGVQ